MVNQNASPVYALNPKTGFCIEPYLALQVRPCGVAGVSVKCRRSAFLASPATQIGHRGQKVSQVRRILQTCDALRCHLRHFLLSPAMSRAATCDSSFCHLGRLITADGESEAAFHHETEGMDGKTIDVCPANTGKIVAYCRIEIDAQPGSDHELCTGAYACRPLE